MYMYAYVCIHVRIVTSLILLIIFIGKDKFCRKLLLLSSLVLISLHPPKLILSQELCDCYNIAVFFNFFMNFLLLPTSNSVMQAVTKPCFAFSHQGKTVQAKSLNSCLNLASLGCESYRLSFPL